MYTPSFASDFSPISEVLLSICATRESVIDISNCIIIKYCYSNHLIPISFLYDFWFLRKTRFRRYTPSIFYDF